ncbi:non-ribosomal peptide synthetase [Pseudonocardia sp. ICBG1142]|uniref:non-ribosomal peptide synthetase n=1 Tax=Pseudonocardia sp. ICBG1142 TaxID=2846760 RepID=UPI001CF708DD|nr:non-ribosomal peptide synthetase [Pseudonocardia sp. ICBG1142]
MTDVESRIAALSPQQREQLELRVAQLAAAHTPARGERIRPRVGTGEVPLALQQEREWAMAQFRSANNIPGAFRVQGRLDIELYGRVLTDVLARHEVLRSTVELRSDGTRVQVLHPSAPVPTPVVDLTDRTPAEQRAEVQRRWTAEVVQPFDPAGAQRLRTTVLRMGTDDHVVLITTDHAAADLVSMAILVQEFAALYAHRSTGGPGLPAPELQYADFAAWQRDLGAQRTTEEIEHWRQVLDGVPGPLVLPSDRPYPARPTFAGAAHVVELSTTLSARIRDFAEKEQASIGVVLLASLSVLLQRYLERDDLIIGEIVSGRGRAEVERMIGCFVTALPLRLRMSSDDTLYDVVNRARQTALAAYDHQDLPVERLVEELKLGREASQTSLTHMWLDVRTPESSLEMPGLRISREPIEVTMSAAPLTLDADPNPERIRLQWVYMTDMFDEATVRLLAEQFGTVLESVVARPRTPVSDIELATGGSAPAVPEPSGDGPCFVELFERRVAQAPYSVAVVHDGVATGYTELNSAVNRLSRHLSSLGAGPETAVGILVDRSVRLPEAMLAVLKAGAVALPLDPAYPPDRMAYMLADSEAVVLVTERQHAAALSAAGVAVPDTVVLLDDDAERAAWECLDDSDPDRRPVPGSAAYIVYTSGSTGRPKGTAVEHRSLATFARDVVDRLGLGTGDRFLQFASPGFDVLVEELFPVWSAGGAVVIPNGHIVSGAVDLAELVRRERITVMELPTAYWHGWARELHRRDVSLPDHLRLVIIGGERVLPDRIRLWRRTAVPLTHVYGLTETTVSSTFFRLDPGDPVQDWPNLPIGTPLPSADLRILDRGLRPAPLGATGELYIGGSGVARGYVGRPGLTATRFVADPAGGGARLYRTGDLVRRRPDGNLEFLSRVDTQIKIRGFRVEPTEVEAALGRLPGIAAAVVSLYEPAPGDRRLVAHVVPRPGAETGAGDLRASLETELPPYMVPSMFVVLDELPLNANGKVDRSALPAPDSTRAEVGEEYLPPQTPVQRRLADVVSAVVGVGRIGIRDNFFEIGGDSILAIQVVARAQDAGIRLSPYDLFTHPTVQELADVVSAGLVVDADQGDVTGPMPVVPAQRPYCVADAPQPGHRNVSVLVEFGSAISEDVVGAAVEDLMGHHDGLRQRVLIAGERTRARIAPRGDRTPFESHDLSDIDDAAAERRTVEIADTLQRSLDPAVGPLVRAALLRSGGRRPDRLALVAHRLVADSASLRIMIEDLRTAVVQRAAGRDVHLPAKTTSWQSWARRLGAHAGSDEVQAERGYWTVLAERSGSSGGGPADLVRLQDAETCSGVVGDAPVLAAAAAAVGCRTEEVLLAALCRALTATSGSGRHRVSVERAGREPLFDDVDLSRTVGRFAFAHPVVLDSGPDTAPGTTLKNVKQGLRGAPSGGVRWPLLRRDSDPVPPVMTTVSFAFRDSLDPPAADGFRVVSTRAGADDAPDAPMSHPLQMTAQVVTGELQIELRWDPACRCRPEAERLLETVLHETATLTRRAGAEPLHTPSDFPLARVDQQQLDQLLGSL